MRVRALFAGLAVLVALFCGAAECGQARGRGQYKSSHLPGWKLLEAGSYPAAATFFEGYLADVPGDLEALFGLAAAQCHFDAAKALATVKLAVEGGLPASRFVAGPRAWLKPLEADPAFQEFIGQQGILLVHGPLVGCVTDHGASFWVRTTAEAPIQVVVSESKDLDAPVRSPIVRTSKDADFTAVAAVGGLKPGTAYWYDVLVDGKPALGASRPTFRTFPPAGQKAKFVVAFGGGAGYNPQNERMWDTVAAFKPLALLLLGDNVYIDMPKNPDIQRYHYYRRQSRPEFRRLTASAGVFAIWDDHDFGDNDCIPGPEVREPAWKIPVWHVFRENWNNPAYGGGTEEHPGCWFDLGISDVDFFFTDGRYYRMSPKEPHPSMLGPYQKRWLLDRLAASKATFKVLISGVPMASSTKPGSLDTWDGFKEEREEILAFLERQRIGGVFILTADRHRSDVWKLDREVGYPLYEFESSRLTNQHVHGKMQGALFSYNAKQSFGLLTFDTTLADPEVTYRIYNIDSELIHTITLKKSQLTPGQ